MTDEDAGLTAGEWIHEYLPSPSDSSKPFTLTDSQIEFLIDFYALGPDGRFLYRRGALQWPKGAGKSPLAAAIALFEFAGPCLPDGTDAGGNEVGRPWGTAGSPPAWVQIAANSEAQADSNVFALLWSWLEVNDGAAAEALGIDQGRSRLYLKSSPGSKLESVSSESGSREGQRTTFAVLDESHLWTKSTGGLRLARTLLRNAAKMSGRTLECSNAFETGGGSVAEATADAFEAGEPGILYTTTRPSVEPTPEMSDAELLRALGEVYAGAVWVDLDRILAEIRDPGTTWAEGVRYYLNVPGTGASALVDPKKWAALSRRVTLPRDGSRVGLGFVGPSTAGAALVLCTEAGDLSVLGIWGDSVPRQEVADAITDAFGRFQPRLFIDPRGWRTEAEAWDVEHPDAVVAFPTNSPTRMAQVLDCFEVALSGDVHHDGDPELASHFANARLRQTRAGHTLEEAHPDRPIVGAQAALLAFEAAKTIPPPEEEMALPAVEWLDLEGSNVDSDAGMGERGWHSVL